MRLLLVEDNRRLSEFVGAGLKKSGFASDPVFDAEEALAAIETQEYDLVILDLGLPDRDGLILLKDIRAKKKNLPVLILTARDSVDDRIRGLNGGGDDYLIKPFAIEELAARVRALLRRPGHSLGVNLDAGNITFDTEARTVSIAGKAVSFTPRELELLEQLMRRAGQVVDKERIEASLYSYNDSGSANSVEVLIHRLRKKLEENGADVEIHTLRGVGYLLSSLKNDNEA